METPGDYLNRFLTRREQIALVAVIAALCVGLSALYWYSDREDAADAPILVNAENGDTAPATATPAEDESAEAPGAEDVPAEAAQDAAALEIHVTEEAPPGEVAVGVQGAVRRPGVYVLDEGARVDDLIREARGLTEEADVSELNRAAELIDGTTLVVPRGALSEVVDGRLTLRGRQSALALNPPAYTVYGWERRVPASDGPPTPPSAPSEADAADGSDGGLINLNTASQSELETLPGIGPVLAGEIVRYRATRPFSSIEEVHQVSGIGPQRFEAIRELITVR